MRVSRRQATDADTELARQIHHRGYREIVERQFGPWDEARQGHFFEDDWDPALYEIVCCDDVPCGRISVVDRADAIIVRDVVILPECQNRGMGTILLQEQIARARRRGVPVQLGTHRLNRALRLYLRLGFGEIGQTDTHILLEAR
jgi:GNAT superfamily N-acetyltransferase